MIEVNHLYILIKLYPDKPWNWYSISQNPNITWEIIQQNPDKPWNWSSISINPNITWKIIQQNPDKPWCWYGISRNKFNRDKHIHSRNLLKHYLHKWKLYTKQRTTTRLYLKLTLHELKLRRRDHENNIQTKILLL